MKKTKQNKKWMAACILCSMLSVSHAWAVVYPWDLTEWIKTTAEYPVTSEENLAKLFDNDLNTEYVLSGNTAVIEIELENKVFLSGWALKVTDGATVKVEYKKEGENNWMEIPRAMVYPSEESGLAPFPVDPFTIGEEDGFLFYGSDKNDNDIRSDDGLRHFRLTVEGENATIAEWQLFGAPRRANEDNYRHYPDDLFSEYAPDLQDWEKAYEDPNFTFSRKGDYGDIHEIFNKWGGSRWNIEPGTLIEEVGMYFEYTFPEPVTASSYGIQCFENSPERTPNGWKVSAKNDDDEDWTVLHTVSGFTFPFPYKWGWNGELGTDIQVQNSPTLFLFSFDDPGAYTTYRFEVTEDLTKWCLELSQFALYAPVPENYTMNNLSELIAFNEEGITGEKVKDLTIRGNDITQEEMDKVYNRVAKITGTLTWENLGDHVTTTAGFFDRIEIEGAVILKGCPGLEDLSGLAGYSLISGDLVIHNTAITDFSALSVEEIQGALDVQDNEYLVNLLGLDNLTRLHGNLLLLNNKIPVNYSASETDKIGLCLVKEWVENQVVNTENSIALSDEAGNPVQYENLSSCDTGTNNTVVIAGDRIPLYPNPVADKLYLSSGEKITEVQVLNMIGQCVLSLTDVAGEADLSTLSSGNYILLITMEDETVQRHKIIKL